MPAPPKLREDLRFTYGADPATGVLIEDPATGDFLRTDGIAAAFARLLDGRRSPAEALDRLRRDFGSEPMAEAEAASLLEELRLNGLLEAEPGATTRVLRKRQIGAVSQRLRLGSFDPFFARIAPYFAKLYSPVGWVAWAILLAVGIATLLGRWETFSTELGRMWSIHAVVWFWLAWMVSKAWHELQHAVVARHYGVEVREVGLLFILLFPLGAYVDVTGVWRLESRWQRLHITVAGIVGELGLGALAILLWAQAPPGEWQAFLHALIVATMVSALLFNANPLMRFDGYHALVDLLRLPNLYQRGMVEVRAQCLKLLTGERRASPEAPAVALYGWLSLGWRTMVGGSLTLVASRFAFGFGLVLAAFLAWQLVGTPLVRMSKAVWQLGPRARWRAASRVTILAGLLGLAWFVPVPTRIVAPALVDFRDSAEVRVGASGIVRLVEVTSGEQVVAGAVVAQLENTKLDADRKKQAADLDRVALELSRAEAGSELRGAKDAAEQLATARAKLDELDRQLAALSVVSPRAGSVLEHDPEALEARWLERGDPVFEIADPRSLEIRAWLLPRDVEWLPGTSTMLFEPAVFGATAIPVVLDRVDPAASSKLPPDGLTARGGGTLAIDTRGREPRLFEPRIEATYAFDANARRTLAGVPGRLVSNLVWHPAGELVTRWFSTLPIPTPSM